MNSRLTANKIIVKLLRDKISFAKTLTNAESFVQELCYGVSRWYLQLDFIAKKLLTKPLKSKDLDIYILILTGLYEIIYMRTPSHAAINENVENARKLKKPWACNLINAVLHNFLRQQDAIFDAVNKNVIAKFSHPSWLIKKIKSTYPNDWEKILAANNEHPPMSLRINLQKTTVKDYLHQTNAATNPVCASCITLQKPCPVSQLPGFADGEVSVQDCGAQFAAKLLDLKPNQRVLDACAAPGGKTMHILETEPNIKELVAVDHDKKRLQMVTENLKRIRTQKDKVKLLHADILQIKSWWNQQLFDRILLDAPCSATGVIRRHPDIKLLKQEKDIKKLVRKQLEILQTIWPILKPNGLLVYVTCSILPEENDQVISKFLAKTPDVQINKIDTPWGTPTKHGRQILPGQNNMDGFFYAVIRKIVNLNYETRN
ncbi:MAG: 16S rRNA (cytosine(967)-C(5))-methyltransferase RsmB [Gammaproteobacteria bacterium]|jgi:16S rRNA (cytosine967-C5)-methyltransferase